MMFIMITKTDRTLPDPPFRPDPMDLDWGANRRQSQLEGQLGRTGLCGPKRGLFYLGRIDTYLGRSSRAEDSRGLWREAELAIRPPLAARSNI